MSDMLTEDEAKKKWCPLARDNRSEDDESVVDCLASGCMFWRWSHQDTNGMPTGFCGGAGLPKYI
jgi:hypothetical protein